jgi:hypothetical protein
MTVIARRSAEGVGKILGGEARKENADPHPTARQDLCPDPPFSLARVLDFPPDHRPYNLTDCHPRAFADHLHFDTVFVKHKVAVSVITLQRIVKDNHPNGYLPVSKAPSCPVKRIHRERYYAVVFPVNAVAIPSHVIGRAEQRSRNRGLPAIKANRVSEILLYDVGWESAEEVLRSRKCSDRRPTTLMKVPGNPLVGAAAIRSSRQPDACPRRPAEYRGRSV